MASPARAINPVEFVQQGRRLFVDTNVLMDTRASVAGGLKRLFERTQDTILADSNPIVVPSKVLDELAKHAAMDAITEPDRADAIVKAGTSLTFLRSASQAGLVRTDLGDGSNPYADDLFVDLFERFASTYDMCLLTRDITLALRVRLMALKLGRNLVGAELDKDGMLQVESDQSLFDRAARKHAHKCRKVDEGSANPRDVSEAEVLGPLLDEFLNVVGVVAPRPASRPSKDDEALRVARARRAATGAFSTRPHKKPTDTTLQVRSIPTTGDRLVEVPAKGDRAFMLGPLLGEGAEGAVYEGKSGSVVKIFNAEHLTRHRKEKIALMVDHGLSVKGACIPTASVMSAEGEFVGYVMSRAEGKTLQSMLFNPKKFRREHPRWKKSDLVDICISFLEQVVYLHSMNVVLGDINPKNVMVDDAKHLSIIDADSWQLEGYPCPVGTEMFTPPRLQGQPLGDVLRTEQDDLYAVATMLFMIVMTGQFPYARKGTDGDMVKLIKEGKFAFQYESHNDQDQPEGNWKFMWSHIHKPVKDLFWNTFHRRGKRYRNRPTAEEWLQVFKAYRAHLADPVDNFDPMSNDIYPTRFKAFRPDTPIKDCPTCGTKNGIAGIWHDDTQEYWVPSQCGKCHGAAPQKSTQSRPKPDDTFDCRGCGKRFQRSQLVRGSCGACNTLDPTRPCERCGKPFIEFGNIAWHQKSGKLIPTTHKAGPGGRYPPECQPTKTTSTTPPNKPRQAQQPQPAKPKSLWSRFMDWLTR